MRDLNLEDAERMIDQIVGDNPPKLAVWTSREWMNLHRQFFALKARSHPPLDFEIHQIIRRLEDQSHVLPRYQTHAKEHTLEWQAARMIEKLATELKHCQELAAAYASELTKK